MYALVKVAGKQYKVEPEQVIRVARLADDVGKVLEIKEIMAIAQGESLRLGQPFIEGAVVKAEVLDHGSGPKIRVFKQKRRKKYRRTLGQRLRYTTLKITAIA